MVNYINFAILVIGICLFCMSHRRKDDYHINQVPFILVIVILTTIGVFFATSDEETLTGIPTVKISHNSIDNINPSCDARLNMSGVYNNNTNKFFLTDATTLDDLQDFIDSNNGLCEFIIYDSDDKIVFSHIFKKPNASEILQVYKEWKSTGKFDLNQVRVEFLNIFYVNQI